MEKGFFIGNSKGIADKSGNKLNESLKKEKKTTEAKAEKIQNELQSEANLTAEIKNLRSGKSELRGKEREDAIEKKEAELEKARKEQKIREAREDIERLEQEAKNAEGGEVRSGFVDKTKSVDYDKLIKEKTEKLRKLEADVKGEATKETKTEEKSSETKDDTNAETKKEEAEARTEDKKEETPKKLTPEEKIAEYFGKDESTVAKTYDKDGNEIDSNFGKTAEVKKTLEQRNKEEMAKYFGKDESTTVKNYDKDGNEIKDPESGEARPEKPGGGGPEKPPAKEELEEKWKAVEEARKNYLEIDYKKKTGLKRLSRFFGGILKTGSDKNYEKDEEVAHLQAIYENALFDYKTAVLDDAKSKKLSNKELGDVVKLFDTETKLNLSEGHDNVKFENQDHRVLNWAKQGVDWYKKQPLIKKMAIGAAFGLATMGSVYAGAATMAIVGGAVALRRVFMGMVTGTTVALGAEALTKRRTGKRINKDTAKFTAGLEKLSYEEKLKRVEESLKGKIKAEDSNMKSIKNKNLRNLGLGVLAGTLVGSSSLIWEKLSGLFGGSASVVENVGTPKGGGLGYDEFKSNILGQQQPGGVRVPDEWLDQGAGNFVETAKPGDSVWKMAERQLEQHFGEKFTSLEGPEKTHIIDAIKDRVAENPQAFGLQNIDQVAAGQQIDFSSIVQNNPNLDNIFETGGNLSDEAYDSISGNNEAVRSWVENHPGEKLTSAKVEDIITGKTSMASEQAGNLTGEEAGWNRFSSAEAGPDVAETVQIKDFSTELQSNLNELTGDNPALRGQNWETIDDWKVDYAITNTHPNMPYLDKSIAGIENKYSQIIGSDAKHLPNETVKEWLARVTRAAAEKAK